MRIPKFVISFIWGPIRTEIDPVSKVEVLTHLQKLSRFGFIFHWPFGLHIWFFWKKQQIKADGSWIPGSEQGVYMRSPGYRWDYDLGMIRTNGYIGGHWD